MFFTRQKHWVLTKRGILMKGLFFSLLMCLFSLFFTPFASASDDYPYRDESHPDCRDTGYCDELSEIDA